jgi:NAD-specific glutamate dehydrogenase
VLPLGKLDGYAKLVDNLKERRRAARAREPAAEAAAGAARFTGAGVPADLVHDVVAIDYMRPSPYLITIAKTMKTRLQDAVAAHTLIGKRLGFDQLVAALGSLPAPNAFEKTFNDKLLHRLGYHQGRLTNHVLGARGVFAEGR